MEANFFKDYMIVTIILVLSLFPFLLLFLDILMRGVPSRERLQNQPVEAGITWTKEAFQSAKKRILIVGGEGNPRYYLSQGFLKEIEEALSRAVRVDVILGPQLCIPADQKECLELLKENKGEPKQEELESVYSLLKFVFNGVRNNGSTNKINLYCSNERQQLYYRVADNRFVFQEDPHLPLAEIRNATVIKNSRYKGKELESSFESLISSGICKKIETPADAWKTFRWFTKDVS